MAFLDKVMKGVSDAGSKAKVLVDVKKLELEISHLQKENILDYTEIGKIVYKSSDNHLSQIDSEINLYIDRIKKREQEIASINVKVLECTGERMCICGKTGSLDLKFCPHCGQQY